MTQGCAPKKTRCKLSIVLNLFLVSAAFTSVVAQFHDVNPYRWPGWFMVVLAALQALATVLFFWEPREFTRPKLPHLSLSWVKAMKLSFQLTSQWKRHCSVSLHIANEQCQTLHYSTMILYVTKPYHAFVGLE